METLGGKPYVYKTDKASIYHETGKGKGITVDLEIYISDELIVF